MEKTHCIYFKMTLLLFKEKQKCIFAFKRADSFIDRRLD